MNKKTPSQHAFFNPRALVAFALCLIGALLAFFAFNAATSRTAKAQGSQQPTAASGLAADASAKSAADLAPVLPVESRPLRDIVPIHPLAAPGHDHPEPIRPNLKALRGGDSDPTLDELPGPVTAAPVSERPTSTGIKWDGVGVGLAGFSPSSNPPDVNGRVGATQYVQWNNTSFAIFSKTGALLYGPAAGNTLFQELGGACVQHNDGDPVVSYDILSGRWILSQFVVGAAPAFSHQCIAVSQTQDALGKYFLYDFVTDKDNFVDYPHTGVWPDGYYMTTHVFNAAGDTHLFSRVYVFEREKMLQGKPARKVSANFKEYGGRIQYGMLPADLDSLTPPPPGEASFVLGPHPSDNSLTASTRVAVTWGATPTIALTEATIANIAYRDAPCAGDFTARQCVPEPPPATPQDYLDNIGRHFMYRLAYRNDGTVDQPQESMVANITVLGRPSFGQHSAIRWFEFRNAGNSTASPTIYQQRTYDPDGNWRWLGSIAMDKAHNVALGYSISSTGVKPSINVAGHRGGGILGSMGGEVTLQDGQGVQQGGGNRWGDYSAMTLDPVDQCTFYYTNEYLKTDGAFNWSTKIGSYRLWTCPDAPAWGKVEGTITSCGTGAPVSGVTVNLSNGFAGATDENGHYSIVVPAGSYTAKAGDRDRDCKSATPASAPVTVTSGGTANQNFCVTGSPKLVLDSVKIDDANTGNGNGVVNKFECIAVNIGVKNVGCATEVGNTARLTTSTPGVTITQPGAAYGRMDIDASRVNSVPFKIETAKTFVCGTDIALTLHLTNGGGTKDIPLSVPSCAGGPSQAIPPNTLDPTDPVATDRMGRTGFPSTCEGKACPGGIGGNPTTRYYQKFNFRNDVGTPGCFTVHLNAQAGGSTDLVSTAYQGSFDPNNLCKNYLGDSGISGLGSTETHVDYSFVVPGNSDFVIVVSTTDQNTSSEFSGSVSGFYDKTFGPGPCSTAAPSGTQADSQ
jgi:hypothetical protein